ncbi:MAG: hypothetical protein WA113_09265 [Desulfitobacteriaceae bacterium]
MNYERIAEMVHELVKNPKSLLSSEQGVASKDQNEFSIVKKVFSKYEVSGGTLTFAIIPESYWG